MGARGGSAGGASERTASRPSDWLVKLAIESAACCWRITVRSPSTLEVGLGRGWLAGDIEGGAGCGGAELSSRAALPVSAASDSDYGLQAGIFTHDDRVIAAAVDGIEAGGIMVNDVSTFRVDHMPYGGVKLSGFGREGLRYAIEEMSELKLVTYNRR